MYARVVGVLAGISLFSSAWRQSILLDSSIGLLSLRALIARQYVRLLQLSPRHGWG